MTKEQQKQEFNYYDISLYGQNPDHNLPKACDDQICMIKPMLIQACLMA